MVVALVDMGDRFRLIVNEIDLVPPDAPMAKLPVGRAVWRPRPNFSTATESWLMAGGSHHTVLTRAVGPEVIADFAEMAGVEFLLINGDTNVASFKNELRWNEAYFHLARGLR
jgi:L-arabinose isomerase